MSDVSRRVARGFLVWVLVLGGVAVAVHPEGCGEPNASQLQEAAHRAVGWFAANLDDDGSFVYRYDRDKADRVGGYNDVRHAGVLWSLYQAETHGIAGAGEIAEKGLVFVDERINEMSTGTVFGRGSTVSTGATALLVAALDQRRIATGATDRDPLLLSLGRTLAATVTPEGAVAAAIDRDDGPLDSRSPFFTGEVLWALARLHLTFPDEGFDQPALRVRAYLINDRDRIETPWPPVSDHWGAYAFATMGRWPDPPTLDRAARVWLDRQLGLFGLQVRYESQRQGGITILTRGPNALAAGVGTLGEGIGNHLAFIERGRFDDLDLEALKDRATCAAHLLVKRQVTAEEALDDPEPDRVLGAWFRGGFTQMDDQQHALSALLLLEEWMSS